MKYLLLLNSIFKEAILLLLAYRFSVGLLYPPLAIKLLTSNDLLMIYLFSHTGVTFGHTPERIPCSLCVNILGNKQDSDS